MDGAKHYQATGIADIILRHQTRALAVLELKKKDIDLTVADAEQALSYARMLVPPAPLVIVTNGRETRILATRTGEPWNPEERNKDEFALLVKNAAQVAAGDIKRAVETLMGTNAQVWREAVREVTRNKLEELTGDWVDHKSPFVREFVVPRIATERVVHSIMKERKRLVIVEGPPMIGKSHVLREIAIGNLCCDDVSFLFLESESGRGVFETLADALGVALGWPITADEARVWLRRVSQSEATRIWVLIDGFLNNQGAGRRDIEDLSSDYFGQGLAVVVAMDDTVADQVVEGDNQRSQSPIGRRAARVSVRKLNAKEFLSAKRALEVHRIAMIKGAEFTHEYRQPWMLRAAAAAAQSGLEHVAPSLSLALPPFQGFNLIEITRARFSHPADRRVFKHLAQALLEEIEDRGRSAQLALSGCDLFLIRDDTLDTHIDTDIRRNLISRGLIKEVILPREETGVVVRLPELLACELARIVETKIGELADGPEALTDWLTHIAGLMPLGDVVVARAILDRARSPHQQKFNIIEALSAMAPVREPPLPAGAKVLVMFPDDEAATVTVADDGATLTLSDGTAIFMSKDSEEWSGQTYSNLYPWLILSHLVEVPFAVRVNDTENRVDLELMLDIASAPMVLRKNGSDPELQTLSIFEFKDVSAVALEVGIVEPITYSLLRFFLRGEACVDEWMDAAIARNNYPLLHRIWTALEQAKSMANSGIGLWAASTLSAKIVPAVHAFFKEQAQTLSGNQHP